MLLTYLFCLFGVSLLLLLRRKSELSWTNIDNIKLMVVEVMGYIMRLFYHIKWFNC